MFRSLLSCASIFVLLISTLLTPTSVSARRCGEKLPVTLLSLYRSSQFIYVGTFDRIEEGEPAKETAGYKIVPIKKFFSLSYSLKGETKKMLVLEDSEYRFDSIPVAVEENTSTEPDTSDGAAVEENVNTSTESDESDVEEMDAEVEDAEVKPGDRVLLFLNKDDDTGDPELADYRDGLKKMTQEKLSSYEPRIRELNEIFSHDDPSYSDLVAWIVRCAEDPQTRWEGTYELLRSFQTLDWRAERAKEADEPKTDMEKEQENEPAHYEPQPPKKFDTGDENFAKAITEGQKLILTQTLLNRKRPDPKGRADRNENAGLNLGDRELIEIVKHWGNAEVAADLLAQLRYYTSDANLNSDLMESIASILADDDLNQVAAEYSDIRWRDDEDEVEAEEPEEAENEQTATAPADNTGDQVVFRLVQPVATQPVPESGDEAEDSDGTAPAASSAKAEPKGKTYGQIRADLLKKFLERAEWLIAEKSKAEK